MNCKLVLSNRSQFFHSRLFFSNQAKLRSTTQRLGITLNVCKFAALGDLHSHVLTQNFTHALRIGLANIAAVAQNACTLLRPGLQRCSAPLR